MRIIPAALASAMMLTACVNVNVNVKPDSDEAAEADETAETGEIGEVEEADEEEVNEIFDITMPESLAGTYVITTHDNGYAVSDKEAYEANYGGFIFDVFAYEKPSEYAGGIDMKIGEIVNGDKVLYDVVAGYPTDIQYDYNKYPDNPPETYTALCNSVEDILKTVKPKIEGEFVLGGGCKGEDLYDDVIKKHITAIEENWDSNKLEEENMSPMYNVMNMDGNALDIAGYAYMDVNLDGIDELLIGEIADGDYKGTVYDIYTMVDRKPAHVVSGSDRDRYYPLKYALIINEGSGGADDSEWQSYDIEANTTNLLPQLGVKMDGYEDKDNPWFVSYGSPGEWESITEEEFNDYMSRFEYVRLDFTPLSSFK